MRATINSVRIAMLAAGVLLFSSAAWADFSGQFAVGNWTISTQTFGCGSSSVVTTAAPVSVTLTTGTGCASIGASFVYPSAPSAGTVTFDYTYTAGVDGAADYLASYVVNGAATQFSDSSGAVAQTGSATFTVAQGQSFGFVFQASNSEGQLDSLTISNFTFNATTPVRLQSFTVD